MSPLLWLAGYGRSLAEDVKLGAADRARLQLVGAGVALSCCVAAFNIGLASTWVTSGRDLMTQAAVAASAAAAGIYYVIVWDRGLIVAADQRASRLGITRFAFLRAMLILVFAASSVLKIAPSFLHAELSSQAVEMREGNDAQRSGMYSRQYDLAGLAGQEASSRTEVNRLRDELTRIPPPIADALAAAGRCSANVQRARSRLVAAGMARREAVRRYAAAAAACQRERAAVAGELARHRAGLAADLETMRARAGEAGARRVAAENEVRERSVAGRALDVQTVTAASLETLLVLMRENPLALFQVVALFLLLTFAEGAGLLLKAALGRTEAGQQIGADRAIAEAEAEARSAIGRVRAEAGLASDEAFARAMIDSLASPEVEAELRHASARLMSVTAPLAAAAMAARQIEERSREIGRIARRNPTLAQILGDLLDDAVATAARNFAEGRS